METKINIQPKILTCTSANLFIEFAKNLRLDAIDFKLISPSKSQLMSLQKVETVKYEDITRMGLTRPYSKVAPLPRLLVEQNPGVKPSDPK